MSAKPWHPFRRTGCGLRGSVCILMAISVTVVVPLLWFFDSDNRQTQNATTPTALPTIQPTANLSNTDPRPASLGRHKRELRKAIHLTFTRNVTRTAVFDLCSVIDCGIDPKKQQQSTKFLCNAPSGKRPIIYPSKCSREGGPTVLWGGKKLMCVDEQKQGHFDRISFFVRPAPPGCGIYSCNPITLTLTNPQPCDATQYYKLHSDDGRIFLWGLIYIRVEEPLKPRASGPTVPSLAVTTAWPMGQKLVKYIDISSLQDKLAFETGYSERNEWLDWLYYTTQQNAPKKNCLACAAARPMLGTAPFPLNPNTDLEGFLCMLKLYTTVSDPNCRSLHLLFPPTPYSIRAPGFTPYEGDYTCLTRSGQGQNVGTLQSCRVILDVGAGDEGIKDEWLKRQSLSRADIWWYCGGKALLAKLPDDWAGTCALTQLVMPFYIMPLDGETTREFETLRRVSLRVKRELSPGGSFDNRVYIDKIGVPRGVPDQYKARNQIAAGFESLFFWWVTVNKNVDWINYIYYNQQRFINYTRDGISGLAEQLDKTSLMTWQNRMALDMLLAEKGGVCKMFGDVCCTFIPNNTAPDGSVTKAISGLTALADEFADNSGFDNPFTSWLEGMFGKWSALMQSVLVSLAVMIAIVATCGCCCIPFLRALTLRLIETAMTRTSLYSEPKHLMFRSYYRRKITKYEYASEPTDPSDISDGEEPSCSLAELFDDTSV